MRSNSSWRLLRPAGWVKRIPSSPGKTVQNWPYNVQSRAKRNRIPSVEPGPTRGRKPCRDRVTASRGCPTSPMLRQRVGQIAQPTAGRGSSESTDQASA
jgi:hypothetical protein